MQAATEKKPAVERFHSRPFIFIEELLEFVHFLLVLVLAADDDVLELLLARTGRIMESISFAVGAVGAIFLTDENLVLSAGPF